MIRQDSFLPENTIFILLCFEGPDRYAMAGGLSVRVDNLSSTLAEMGYTTHLFFIGDPHLKGEETRAKGKLILHRWCQWLSQYHPNGVYDGEEAKLDDYNRSIPPYVMAHVIQPAVAEGKFVVILGEEWQTSEVISRLSDALYYEGLRNKTVLFWNANNFFSFHRINWGRLNYTATVTSVSRYMKHCMWGMGLNPLVIPNGIPRAQLRRVDEALVDQLRQALDTTLLFSKVARWDPDKGWIEAVEAISRLKERRVKSILLARGGIEPYGYEVMRRARLLGLTVREAHTQEETFDGYLAAIKAALPADIVDIRFHLPPDFLRVMYRASDGTLANSGHEPFGIVGLEAMAAGGVAFTGSTGEDYAISFVNAFVLETTDPKEIVAYMVYLMNYPEESQRIRKAARLTAGYFTWDAAAQNLISKLENQARIQGTLSGAVTPQITYIPAATLVSAGLVRHRVGDTLEQSVLKKKNGESSECSLPVEGKEVLKNGPS
jgi:glycosyltransferase involved in cell wall biosynthesis